MTYFDTCGKRAISILLQYLSKGQNGELCIYRYDSILSKNIGLCNPSLNAEMPNLGRHRKLRWSSLLGYPLMIVWTHQEPKLTISDPVSLIPAFCIIHLKLIKKEHLASGTIKKAKQVGKCQKNRILTFQLK